MPVVRHPQHADSRRNRIAADRQPWMFASVLPAEDFRPDKGSHGVSGGEAVMCAAVRTQHMGTVLDAGVHAGSQNIGQGGERRQVTQAVRPAHATAVQRINTCHRNKLQEIVNRGDRPDLFLRPILHSHVHLLEIREKGHRRPVPDQGGRQQHAGKTEIMGVIRAGQRVALLPVQGAAAQKR